MKTLRYLNPFFIRSAVRDIRRVFGDGGPKLVRLVGVDHPSGWILPSSTVTIEVEGRDGRKELFCPEIPVPFPYAWAWRIARRLGVPLVRSIEPEKVSFAVPVPGRR
jgi:hypothetical protein